MNENQLKSTCLIFLFLIFLMGPIPLRASSKIVTVTATRSTPPPKTRQDSMDDPAICVHPTDSSKSLIIGTNKSSSEGGLYLYTLKGELVGVNLDGAVNNVDIRYGFPLGKEKIDLVVASRPRNRSLSIYKVDFESQSLENITDPDLKLTIDPYGICLYKSPKTNKFYAFVTTKRGYFHQYELKSTSEGTVTAELLRSVQVGSQCEGITADDQNSRLFVSEEKRGLWSYEADPRSSDARHSVDKVGEDLVADLEGVSLMKNGEKTGYIILSSQGNSTYFVYNRSPPHKKVGGFQIVEDPQKGMEGTEETDGLDACPLNFGKDFPKGLLVVHDNRSSKGGGSNFKLVSWEKIAQKLDLKVDTSLNFSGR